MKTLRQIKKILKTNKLDLRDRYQVKKIGVFGSYARGEQNRKSDVDILVQFRKPIGLFLFLELEEHLSQILELGVDLVTKKALKPRIGEQILREVVYA